MKKNLIEASVMENAPMADGIYRMVLHAEIIALEAQPGQFVMVMKPGDDGVFLRRPFGIADADAAAGTITLIYRIVGRGTRAFAKMTTGELLSIEGPIGHGFTLREGRQLLVGGGLGIAPLIYLAKRLPEKPVFLIGGKNEKEIFWKDVLAPLAEKIYITTDDGSYGTKGFTTTLLPDVLEKEKPAGVVTCGPGVMMKGIAAIVRESGLPCEVSLEKRMACGIGVCLGCTFETTSGVRKKVCVDGPVFPAGEVFV